MKPTLELMDKVAETIERIMQERKAYYAKHLPNVAPELLKAEIGQKYIKLVNCDASYGNRSVYAFIDDLGNIYKPAGWARPAKHIRGNINDPDNSWGKAFGMYGVAYLR